jgi:hypothetical protein
MAQEIAGALGRHARKYAVGLLSKSIKILLDLYLHAPPE